ncbi:hypothetical protein MHB65_17815 [Lysinibacillus sp. FSL K6-0075]|uniref:hypothetical protein n=1 Tax=Lysinibacillus sp. FSL K6-0075 TaxID=2921415 RepID=UPI0031583022
MEHILLELLYEFSEVISVTPPTSMSNILDWWDNTLNEINDYWLTDLMQFQLFSNSETPTVQTMYEMLLKQCNKRENLNIHFMYSCYPQKN